MQSSKKTSFESGHGGGVVRLAFTPVKGHSFWAEVIALAVCMYIRMGCGFRSIVNGLELFNDFLGGALGVIPSHQTIENWLLKAGIVEYLDSCNKFRGKEYAIIIDESITVGSQKLLVILAAPAQHGAETLKHGDVEVLAMAVSSSWKAGDVEREIIKLKDKIGSVPKYIVSDNGHNLRKGAELAGVPRHRDISHTIGLILEEEYNERTDFKEFMDTMNKKRLSYQLTANAYLLPPKLRTISRFMNMSKWMEWTWVIIQVYDDLGESQKAAYTFVLDYKELITELHHVMETVDVVFTKVKKEGLSHTSAKYCKDYIWINLLRKDKIAEGCKRVGRAIRRYINDESVLLKSKDECHNITSDIIESTFGIYKSIQPKNKHCGITPIVLALPLYGKVTDSEKRRKIDFKEKMECVRMADIKDWKDMTLLDNWQVRRMLDLKSKKRKTA